jgi:hypothetical protein
MRLPHEFHHQLMVGTEPSMAQLKSNSPVAIAAFVFNTDLLYNFLLIMMLFRLIQMSQMIVKTAPGEFGCYQELFQWVFLP